VVPPQIFFFLLVVAGFAGNHEQKREVWRASGPPDLPK